MAIYKEMFDNGWCRIQSKNKIQNFRRDQISKSMKLSDIYIKHVKWFKLLVHETFLIEQVENNNTTSTEQYSSKRLTIWTFLE